MNNRTRALIFDSIFFFALVIFSEWMGTKALQNFYTGYYFSISLLASFIFMYRWGAVAIPFAMVSGLVAVLFMSHFQLATLVLYTIGNAGIVLSYCFMKWQSKSKIKSDTGLTVPYVLSGYLSIVILRSLVMACFGEALLSAFFLVLSNEMLNIIAVTMFTTLLMKRKAICVDVEQLYKDLDNEE